MIEEGVRGGEILGVKGAGCRSSRCCRGVGEARRLGGGACWALSLCATTSSRFLPYEPLKGELATVEMVVVRGRGGRMGKLMAYFGSVARVKCDWPTVGGIESEFGCRLFTCEYESCWIRKERKFRRGIIVCLG